MARSSWLLKILFSFSLFFVFFLSGGQVFISYSWGHKNRTQQLVKKLHKRLEMLTDLVCWLDVSGIDRGNWGSCARAWRSPALFCSLT